MARKADRLAENAPGNFFVDSSCIDCDACRQIAPATFRASPREMSIVHTQPQTPAEVERALMALVACPTSSIGTESKAGLDMEAAMARFPERITDDDEIYYCGYAAEASFGALAYLIRRPEGNVLVDSPRAAKPLYKRLEALGGVKTLFLTHGDDVADHEKYREHFGCERILHKGDVAAGTEAVERKLEGTEPIVLAADLLAIPVPGHTRGSVALLYKNKYLFSGDHVWGTERGTLRASRSVCWYSWPEQLRSIERLLDHTFEWILPGHGRRYVAGPESMKVALRRFIQAQRGNEAGLPRP